jgi:hypothetical protein
MGKQYCKLINDYTLQWGFSDDEKYYQSIVGNWILFDTYTDAYDFIADVVEDETIKIKPFQDGQYRFYRVDLDRVYPQCLNYAQAAIQGHTGDRPMSEIGQCLR